MVRQSFAEMFPEQRRQSKLTQCLDAFLSVQLAASIEFAESIYRLGFDKEPIDSLQDSSTDHQTTMYRQGFEMACRNVLRAHVGFPSEKKEYMYENLPDTEEY
jgi:hypothetical protein